jgi:exosortase
LLILPTLLTLGYASLIVAGAPPLLRAMAAACALLATWSAWRWNARPHPAALGLVLLALPALPTAQFVLGFPLRAAAGEMAARLLGLSGLAVVREGVSLRLGDRLVAIDAPCSGVNMLWMAVLLALVLAALAGTSTARTALLVTAASALAIAGNALRAASLFLIESGIAPLPRGMGADTAHVALGVVAFVLAAGPLLWMARRRSASTGAPSAARLRGAKVDGAEAAAP